MKCAAAIAVLALLACSSPPPRPCMCSMTIRLPIIQRPLQMRELEQHLEVLEARVERLAGEVERARRIRAAENEVLLARTKRDRDRAARELLIARRSP
jgi:hypothetical protein